ncbi:MAG TPA: ORF6N domain-containing protein [Terriglobia bacterium]|nr:ORF6N domain-containing protein [Terriglobia bacterium]
MKSQNATSNLAIPPERIERRILLIRGQKVMLDADLAELYEVETKALNRAVRRNLSRFPGDFMFQLTAKEFEALRFHFGTSSLRSQIVTSKGGRGGRRYNPLAFTEQGVAMLSSVLRSHRAVQVNIAIMRAFVKLREMLASHRDLARRLAEMEKKYDAQFRVVFDAIRELMKPPEKPRRRIGFRSPEAP